MSEPTITVVVLNYNGLRNLEECFSSLLRIDFPADRVRLMLADNGSRDGSGEFVRSHYPGVEILALPRNVGFGRGNNAAAEEATTSHVVFLNNDMWVDPGILHGFLDALAERPRAVAAGAKILNWDGTAFDFAGAGLHFAGMGYQEGFQEPFAADRFTDVKPILFPCGGAMMVDREAFLDAGGFDGDFFIYYEDTDLGWRLWLLGHEVVFAPRAVVYHKHHGTMEGFADHRKRVLYRRNSLASVYKNYGDEHVGRFLAAALLGTVDGIVATASSAGRLDPNAFEITSADRSPPREVSLALDEASTLVAVHALVEQLPELHRKREAIQARRVRSDEEIAHLFRWPFKYWPGVGAATQSKVVRALGVDDLFSSLPRRILVLSPDILPYDGLPTVGSGLRAWGLAEGLRSRGHDVVISMPREATTGREAILPADVLERAWDLSNLSDVVSREAPDALVVCGWPVLDALAAAKLAVPVILDQPGPHFLERRYQRFGTDEENRLGKLRALGKADYFTSSGDRQHAYFEEWLADAGWSVDEIETRSASIPYSLAPELPERHPGDELTFVYGGVFLPWQDPTVALETLASELERRNGASLHLFGAHHPFSAIQEGRIAALFERLEASPNVVRHEYVPYDELIRFYATAHVAVDLMAANPERELAFTTRTVVYLWSGLPVIYNDYSELSDYIARYDAGWTIDPTDTAAITTVLDEVFERPEVIRRKSENARRLVREQLDWTKTIGPLDEFVRRASTRASRLELPPVAHTTPSPLEKLRWVYRTHGPAEVARKTLAVARRRIVG